MYYYTLCRLSSMEGSDSGVVAAPCSNCDYRSNIAESATVFLYLCLVYLCICAAIVTIAQTFFSQIFATVFIGQSSRNQVCIDYWAKIIGRVLNIGCVKEKDNGVFGCALSWRRWHSQLSYTVHTKSALQWMQRSGETTLWCTDGRVCIAAVVIC